MTRDEFQIAACALLGTTIGWQSAIARRLGVDSRTVRRWLAEGATPPWVDARMAELMGTAERGPWPRDEWVVGDGVTAAGCRREYVAHLMPPRFVARVVAVDELTGRPEPQELPADATSGTVYQADVGTLLCEVEWIDDPPAGQITALMEAAADAVEWAGDEA